MRGENYFKSTLFKPSKVRSSSGNSKVSNMTLAGNSREMDNQEVIGALASSASFRYDPPGSPLKSTQQLNVDFSKFENHTFFNSALNKTQVAIQKIINKYPFDGSRQEYESFMDGLSGFERYVYNSFPKNMGALGFSSLLETHVSVDDAKGLGNVTAGGLLGAANAMPVMDFTKGPFTCEFHLFVPTVTNDNMVVCQRLLSEDYGFTMAVSSSTSTAEADFVFAMSDSNKNINISTPLSKGIFNHIAAVYDVTNSGRLLVYVNGDLSATSTVFSFMSGANISGTKLLIGSGSMHAQSDYQFEPKQTLTGALDEFRFFMSSRNQSKINKYANINMYAETDLKLYYRFNEPIGDYGPSVNNNQDLVLDHSGNALHNKINGFSMDLRNPTFVNNLKSMLAEDENLSPILFPTFESVQEMIDSMLTDAQDYDVNNPNIITKLVPRHYLDESAYAENVDPDDADLTEFPSPYSNSPGNSRRAETQIIASILFMWAEAFDEMKMFIDEMGRLLKVDYVSDQTISDHLLSFLAKYHDMELPVPFTAATQEQFFAGRSLTNTEAKSIAGLQDVQNAIWRRILSDITEIKRTKGTRRSIESVLRNIGINPNGPFKIKEYGGTKTKKISSAFDLRQEDEDILYPSWYGSKVESDSYEKCQEVASMLTFSGTLGPQGTVLPDGRDTNRPLLVSPFLYSQRVEPGYPPIAGTFVGGASDEPNDGLLTSGSWTLEGTFKMSAETANPQSLMRLHSTGSNAGNPNNWMLFNVVAFPPDVSNSVTGSVHLWGRPLPELNANLLHLKVENIDLFDGSKWYVSFGRNRADENLNVTSSYFLNVGRFRSIGVHDFVNVTTGLLDYGDSPMSVLDPTNNEDGAFVMVGSMSLQYDPASAPHHLNDWPDDDVRIVDFSGKVSNIRFFSKGLSADECKNHMLNFKSAGVRDALTNYNFNVKEEGTFQRLRMDVTTDQIVTSSDGTGQLVLTDFSQNGFETTIKGLEASKQCILPEKFDYQVISPKLESSIADNKVRIRSFLDIANVNNYNTEFAPYHELPADERPMDDRRVEIEVSAVQALNDDMITLFSSLDAFNDYIGSPELVFSREYRDLRNLRRIYFNRLVDRLNIKTFFEFFKWFDDTVGDVLEGLLPFNSQYKGTNFVIESHMLERPKFTYSYQDMYLGEIDRRATSTIYLQQFVGKIRKF